MSNIDLEVICVMVKTEEADGKRTKNPAKYSKTVTLRNKIEKIYTFFKGRQSYQWIYI